MIDRANTMAPLTLPVFRDIWITSNISNFGGQIQAVGAAWLMTSLATSADMVALVQASTTLPIVLFSLVTGAIADSFDRRRVMLVAQVFMFAISTLLMVLAWFGLVTPWMILAFTFLIGCGSALHNPSWQASVGDLVPRAMIPQAVAMSAIGFNITRSVGPAIGGAIVAAAGAAAAFAINAVSYIAFIWVLVRWRPAYEERRLPRENLATAMTTGLRYVAMSPHIENVIGRAFVHGFAGISVLALLPLIARDLLHGGPLTFGVLLGAYGVGAIGGAVIGAPMRDRFTSEQIVRSAFLGYTAGILGAAWGGTLWVAIPAMMVAGGCWVLSMQLFNVTVQLSTPRWVLGRAMAFFQTSSFGGMAVGSWVWGLVAEGQGAVLSLSCAAVIMAFGAAIGLWRALPGQADLNLDPVNRWQEPSLAVELQPRSGPIVITVDYLIREADVPAFTAAMSERRRMRVRNGARHWSLMRDLHDPQLWVESFHSPTWMDYVRQSTRTTYADAEIGQTILKLHAGDAPPRINRRIVRSTSWNDHVNPHPKAALHEVH